VRRSHPLLAPHASMVTVCPLNATKLATHVTGMFMPAS
jgi:hypothetical protein